MDHKETYHILQQSYVPRLEHALPHPQQPDAPADYLCLRLEPACVRLDDKKLHCGGHGP